jgi:hypothetical protein
MEKIIAYHTKTGVYQSELISVCYPFLLLRIPSEKSIYKCFSTFLSRYVPDVLAHEKIMEYPCRYNAKSLT